MFAELLENATSNLEPIVITRRGGEDVVLVAATEYESLRETAYLLRSPRNAERLYDAIDEAKTGGGKRMSSEEFDAFIGDLDAKAKTTSSRKTATRV
jgi:antitoxin YefM